jgi:hypothetical protein
MASRRTYADAVSWIKSTRPEGFARGPSAVKTFGGVFLAGVAGFGAGSIVSPDSFGQEGGRALNLGWPSALLVGMIAISVFVLALHRRRITWLANRNLRHARALTPDESRPYEAAVNALAACPRLYQLRFALAWSWGPGLAACLGALLAVSAAYFAVYSTLAGFDVGAETAAFAAANVLAGLILLTLAAARLSTWRVATAVYRAIAPGYLD